jgi:Tol biopolymer transport system component
LVPGDTNDSDDIFVRDTATNQTIRVSVDSSGNQGDRDSSFAVISADGRFVAFDSYSTQLVNDDNNSAPDIFVRDISAQTTSRVSVSSDGSEGDIDSSRPDISGDGRYVVFTSVATNLVAGDTNSNSDVFIHDQQTQETRLISVNALGEQGNDHSLFSRISDDGSLVVFASRASNLTDDNNDGLYNDDTNGVDDLFISDWQNGTITKITRNANGEEADKYSSPGYKGSISADGRFIVFRSLATNLTPEPDSGTFIYDRANDTIDLIDGTGSDYPTMSADGKYIVFASPNNALVENDTNDKLDVFRIPNNR